MKLKDILILLTVFLWLGLFTYLIWNSITYAEDKDLITKQHYLEQLRIKKAQMEELLSWHNAECQKTAEYYSWQIIYLDATIEQEENSIADRLGLTLQR